MVRYRTGIFVIKTFFVAIYEKSNDNNWYWNDVFVLRYGTGTTYVRTYVRTRVRVSIFLKKGIYLFQFMKISPAIIGTGTVLPVLPFRIV